MSDSYDYESINLDEIEFVSDNEFEDISNDFCNPDGGFESREALDVYVRYVAGLRNITLAVRDSKTNPTRKNKFVRYLCSRGDVYKSKRKTNTRATTTEKINCSFNFIAREYGGSGGRWYVMVENGRHNHPFPTYAEGSRLGQISPVQKQVIRDQEMFNLTPSNMLAYMKRQDSANKTAIKQVYNVVGQIRKEKREGRTPMQNFIHELDKNNYMYEVRTAEESTDLGDIVFCHPASYTMVNAYPEVMMIDCTYNTNEYELPLLEAVGATSTDKTFTIAYAFMRNEREDNYRFVTNNIIILFLLIIQNFNT